MHIPTFIRASVRAKCGHSIILAFSTYQACICVATTGSADGQNPPSGNASPNLSLISPARSGAPDAESPDYLSISDITDDLAFQGEFNTIPKRKLRTVQIAGKTVVFQKGHQNELYERVNCSDADNEDTNAVKNADIKSLIVYGERVIIRDALHLPATNLTVYAKELVFEDVNNTSPASITTTPLSKKLRADQFLAGSKGEDAGAVNLHVEVYRTVPSPQSAAAPQRFVLRGGRGQDGGLGEGGADGPDMKIYPFLQSDSKGGWSIRKDFPPGTVAVLFDWAGFGPSDSGAKYTVRMGDSISAIVKKLNVPENDLIELNHIDPSKDLEIGRKLSIPKKPRLGERKWPDGLPAKPGGAPGNGGSGGILTFYSVPASTEGIKGQLAPLLDCSPGETGAKPPKAIGGKPGTPAHAVWFNNGNGPKAHETVKGPDAEAPNADPENPARLGKLDPKSVSDPDWLQPAALQSVLAYAKDAYIDNQFDAARAALSGYSANTGQPPDNSGVWQELDALRCEVNALQWRLASNLDYFGNPPGWVPALSFQVNMAAYGQEIRPAIRLLYLCRLVNKRADKAQSSAAALEVAARELKDQIKTDSAQYKNLEDRLPEVKKELATVIEEQKEVTRMIAEKQAELQSEAQDVVAARHKKGFLDIVSEIATTVPVFQPTLGKIGTALTNLLGTQSTPSRPLTALTNVTDAFSDANLADAKQQLDQVIATLTIDTSRNTKEYLSQLTKAASEWGQAYGKITKAMESTAVPANEVDAELQRLKAENAEYQDLVDRTAHLLSLKTAFSEDVERTVTSINEKSDAIIAGLHSLDTLNTQRQAAKDQVGFDTIREVKAIERRSLERLVRYKYYVAKAYEYELLQPYPDDLQEERLLSKIETLLDGGNAEDWLSDPLHFDTLVSLYEGELREIAADILAQKNANTPMKTTAPISFPLTAEEVRQLNDVGPVVINLQKRGLIGVTQENARLLTIGASHVDAHVTRRSDVATLHLIFEHSGISIFDLGGQHFVARHYGSISDQPITWGSSFDVLAKGEVQQETAAPGEIALLRHLIGSDPSIPNNPDLFYSHPGANADIVLRRETVPNDAAITIDAVTISASYEFYRSRHQWKQRADAPRSKSTEFKPVISAIVIANKRCER